MSVVYTVLYMYVWYVCTGTTDWDSRGYLLPCGGLTSVWIHFFKRSSSNRKLRSYSGRKATWEGTDDIIVMNAITHATMHPALFVEC